MQRRLAAIVHADLAGFTRMMEGAESRTFRHLKTAQVDIWRPAIEAGGGRLVGTAGDAMLAEFSSAVAAVSAAIDIQERMVLFNESLEDSQRMLFRIGVHLGEVIVDEEDQNIFGEGVNLAARIQGIAEPGGIAVSRAVREMTELRIDYAFIDGGEHRLKNVSRPIHVFHVRQAARAAAAAAQSAPPAKMRFEGADSSGVEHAFEVSLDRLASSANGMAIGRAAGHCELIVSHATVSRRHARLTLVGEALRIEDLGSTNGTAVDGRTARPGTHMPLQAGSRLRVGDVEFSIRQG